MSFFQNLKNKIVYEVNKVSKEQGIIGNLLVVILTGVAYVNFNNAIYGLNGRFFALQFIFGCLGIVSNILMIIYSIRLLIKILRYIFARPEGSFISQDSFVESTNKKSKRTLFKMRSEKNLNQMDWAQKVVDEVEKDAKQGKLYQSKIEELLQICFAGSQITINRYQTPLNEAVQNLETLCEETKKAVQTITADQIISNHEQEILRKYRDEGRRCLDAIENVYLSLLKLQQEKISKNSKVVNESLDELNATVKYYSHTK